MEKAESSELLSFTTTAPVLIQQLRLVPLGTQEDPGFLIYIPPCMKKQQHDVRRDSLHIGKTGYKSVLIAQSQEPVATN